LSRIKARVAGGENATPGTEAGYRPAGGGQASPPAVMTMPLARVIVAPVSWQYATLGAEELTPIWTADGAGVPASAPGTWGQLRAAGRP
jgi:hypothetical protein